MAHHKATKKAIRQNAKVTERNISRRSKVKSALKGVLTAVETKDIDAAKAALRNAESVLMRAVNKGVIKKNTAARRVSRLSAKIKAASAK